MKNLTIIAAVLAVASGARAVQPDRTLESAASATGQNIRIASNADASGEYGVVLGSNKDAADATTLFAVCEKCDDTTATYVFTVTATGNWTLDASAPLITTASTATGLNLGIASGANASGEYGVVVGTTAAAAAGLDLFATAVDVDGTPIYSFVVETIAAGGTGARAYNTASAAGQNMSVTSGANASGEYGVVAGTDAAVTDGTQVFAACADCDGTPVYHFTVAADGSATVGATGTGTVFAGTYDVTGAAGITIGSADVTAITLTTDGSGTGEVVLPLQSIAGAEMLNDTVDGAQLADTIDLDADLAFTLGAAEQFIWNKTATDATGDYGAVFNYTASDTTASTTGQHAVSITNAASTEAADSLIELDNADADDNVVAAILVANATRFDTHFSVGNAPALFGTAAADSFTFTTDGTGDGEVVLPLQSIAGAEMLNDTVDGAQLADTITLDANLVFAGAFSYDIGNNTATTVTIDTDGTGDGELVLPLESVSAGEITNPVRSVSLAMGAAFNCTASEILDWSSGADAKPDFVLFNSAGPAIGYDATGGSVDTDEACLTFTVPADWVSGGTFIFRVTQDVATVTNLESIEVRISIDGTALGAADEDNLADQTAVQSVTSAPVGTQAAGASVSVLFKQGNASADDKVNILSIDYQYVASM